jgi:hypothetical protein
VVVKAITQGLDHLTEFALFVQLTGLDKALLATVDLSPGSKVHQQKATTKQRFTPKRPPLLIV